MAHLGSHLSDQTLCTFIQPEILIITLVLRREQAIDRIVELVRGGLPPLRHSRNIVVAALALISRDISLQNKQQIANQKFCVICAPHTVAGNLHKFSLNPNPN